MLLFNCRNFEFKTQKNPLIIIHIVRSLYIKVESQANHSVSNLQPNSTFELVKVNTNLGDG